MAIVGGFLYAGLYLTAGKVIRVDLSTFEQSGNTITLASGENLIVSMVASGSYLYVGTETSAGKICRIDLVTFLQSGTTITGAAGENNVYALTTDGTYVFAGFGTTAGMVIKISISTFTKSGATLTFAAGENDIRAMVVSGDALYCGLNVAPAKVKKVTISTWTLVSTPVTMSTGENYIFALATDDTYVYCGHLLSPAKITRILISSFLQNGTTVTLYVGELYVRALAVSGTYLYCGLEISPGKIVRIDLTTMQKSGATITFSSGENAVWSLAVSGSYLYCGLDTAPGKVIRVDLTTWTISGATITFAAGENAVAALAVSGSYLYCGCYTTNGKVIRIDLTIWAISGATITFAAGEVNVAALAVSGGYLYCGLYSAPGKVVKIDLGTWAISGTTITFAGGEGSIYALVISGAYLYCGTVNSPGKIIRIDLVGWAISGATITFDTGENNVLSLVVLNNYLYCGLNTSPGKIRIIDLILWSLSGTVFTLATGENGIRAMLLKNSYLYCGMYTIPAYIVQIDPLPYLSLFSRLQSADVGDSFTVRAGLTCAQADPARPVDYAADGHLAPRFKGTLNTEHKIRIHAPNYLEDGGFESGAFSPSWAAGTDWSINSSSPMEGKYDARHALGTSSELVQSRTNKIEAGKTYRVVFKTKTVTAAGTAGLLTITPRLAGAGASLDSTIAGNAPLITTTAQWYAFDFTPAVSSDRWELAASVDVTKKGSATVLALDELYVYEKRFITSLIVDRHNWAGRGPVTVKNFWCSPFRSTAQAREQESFSRASVAYKSDGTQVSSGLPRYESGNFGSAIMVEEGTTNLLTENQASVETDTTGYGSVSGATLTKDTIEHWHGGASLKIVTPGSVNQEGAISTFVSGLTVSVNYSASVWLKGSGTVSLLIGEYTAADAAVGYTNSSPLVLSSAWQRISVTRLFGGTGVKAKIFFLTSDIQAVTFYADGAQLEQKDYPTSWQLPGAARANEGCSFNPEGIVSPAEGTWAQWVNVNDVIKRQITSDFPRVFTLQRSGGSTGLAVTHADSAANWRLYSSDDAGNFTDAFVSDSYTPNGWHQFVVAWTTTTLKIYIDGILRATISNPKLPRAFTTANIGSGNALYWSNTLHDDIRIWNRALADAEIAVDAARTSPAEISPGCTAAFSFDATLDSGYSFSPADSRVVLQPLPTSDLPCVEIILPAISGWTPEIGDLYLGDFWQMPRYPKPMDPYATDEGGLREFELNFSQIPPQYRTAEIESLLERLRENEGIYLKWDTDPPLLVEDDKRTCKASYDPYRIDLPLKFTERL
jgi:hypothetical protein